MADVIRTYGQTLTGGGVLEIQRAAEGAQKLLVLHFDGEAVTAGESLKLCGNTYVPGEVAPGLLEAVNLPAAAAECPDVNQLLNDITTLLLTYSGVGRDLARLSAFFFLMTWLSDCLSVAPRLCVFGPPSRASDQFLRLASAACYHSVFLANVSPAGFLALPFSMGLTVILRQHKIDSLIPIIEVAAKRGQYVPVRGDVVQPFSPVIVHTDLPSFRPADAPLIDIPIWPTHKDPSFLDQKTEGAITKRLQSQLLTFRLKHIARPTENVIDMSKLKSPIAETARALSVTCSDDSKLFAEIVELLRHRNDHLGVLRATSLECLTVEALLFLAHEAQGEADAGVHVNEIASVIEVLSTGRGCRISLSPRAMGNRLRAVGFETTRLDRSGRGLFWLPDLVDRIHRLAADFRVQSFVEGASHCAQCEALLKSQATEGLSE